MWRAASAGKQRIHARQTVAAIFKGPWTLLLYQILACLARCLANFTQQAANNLLLNLQSLLSVVPQKFAPSADTSCMWRGCISARPACCCTCVCCMQVTLQPSPAVQVLGAAKSNAQGLALLAEVKLRARPGTYTLAVASTTDKDVAPALVGCAAT